MPYHPKTYDLGGAIEVVEAWRRAKTRLDEHPHEPIFVAANSHSHALSLIVKFNRVRAAMREQWEDGGQFDHITLRAVSTAADHHAVSFTVKDEDRPIVFLDANGNTF